MKRMKRFVLAEKTEKDPNWKSSDNLLARIFRSMSQNEEEGDRSDEEKDTNESGTELPSTLGLT